MTTSSKERELQSTRE